MSTVPVHMIGVSVVFLGMIIAQGMDLDHLPTIFKIGDFSAFECVYKLQCYPHRESVYHIGEDRALFHVSKEVPLHNMFTVFLLVGVLVLVRYMTKNPYPTLFVTGLIMGVLAHLLLDGMFKF